MRRTPSQRLEARRRALEDQVVVYALTGRTPPETLVADFARARRDAEAARRGEAPAPERSGLMGRWFGALATE